MMTLAIILLCSLCLILGIAFGIVIICTLIISGRISEQEEYLIQHGDLDGDKNEKFI